MKRFDTNILSMFIVSTLFSHIAFSAETTCENYGKFGAIRAYKSEVGTVQGSEGIEYEITKTVKKEDPFYSFVVSITDNNEDGEVWTVDYLVETKRTNKKNKKQKPVCQVLSASRYTPKQSETPAAA